MRRLQFETVNFWTQKIIHAVLENWNYDLQVVTFIVLEVPCVNSETLRMPCIEKAGPFVISSYYYFDVDELRNSPESMFCEFLKLQTLH